jgi:peptidoglycan/xylan/chitin deacetylase (PgdA/CDA1 family)
LLRRWRFERDVNERGYTPDEVQAHEIARAQDAQRFIIGQRARADLVIRFRPGDGDRLGVTIFQRRQPPAFDWNLITGAGMAITPAVVDDDGCTSTVLQIAPTANPADVRNAQCALWSSLAVPRASLDPARLADDPTTAFVQTFVAYHLLRTRLYG